MGACRESRTGVDELLLLWVPSLLLGDSLLDGRDLYPRSAGARRGRVVTHEIGGFNLDGELLLFEVLEGRWSEADLRWRGRDSSVP